MPDRDDFYVGYLPVPWGHSRALRIIVPLTLWVFAVTAGVLAFTQRAPGDGVWDTTEVRTWSGVIREAPYPFLETDDGPLLLVEVGKLGSQDRVAGLDGVHAEVSGWSLTRGDRRMIELEPGEAAISPLEDRSSATPSAARVVKTDATIIGEIVDSKCFLGAMKPGNGKGHKACAILCISGGIPPVVVGQDDSGKPTWAILVIEGHTGPSLPAGWLDRVAEPVQLRGRMSDHHGLPVLVVSDRANGAGDR